MVMVGWELGKLFGRVGGERDDDLIERVDGRIGMGVECGIDVVGVGRVGGVVGFEVVIVDWGFWSWRCGCKGEFGFGGSGVWGKCVFEGVFVFGGFGLGEVLGDGGEVKEGEVEGWGILGGGLYVGVLMWGLGVLCGSLEGVGGG